MQIKNIIASVIFIAFVNANVSCTDMWSKKEKIDIYHCKGVVYPGSSKYYYDFRIDEDKLNVSKMIPDFFAYTPQDKLEFIVEGNSKNLVSKLDSVLKNMKCSKLDLVSGEKKVVIHISGKSLTYYAKSDTEERDIDAVISVIADMYKDDKRVLVKKRE